MAQAADFFVSYTSADRPGRTRSLGKLEVEAPRLSSTPGTSPQATIGPPEVQHATATAERVMAMLSAWYLRSAHGEAEWRVF
jgi:hypothetical protein